MQTVSVTDTSRSTLKTDIAYALVTLGSSMIWAILSGWLLYFYLPPEGEGVVLAPATWYGVVIFGTRALNAVLAPLVGHFSDNLRSRWGRRLPLMFVSGAPLLAFFVLLWTPPLHTESAWNLVYLAGMLVLYNLAYTVNQIPYTALLPELALTDQHRVRMSAWASSFLLIGMIVSGAAGLAIERFGYAGAALLYALLALPMFYLPFLVLRERPDRYATSTAGTWPRRNLRAVVASMWQNRAFVVMTATGVFYWGLTTLVQSAIPYVVTEICLLDTGDTLWFYVPAILGSLVCYPLVTWLAGRLGKWTVFAGSLFASALVLPGLMLIGDWLPFPLMAQGIVWVTLQAIAMSGVTMLPMAFGAEIADHDAALTGQRREGLYYATWGLLDQVINGVVAAFLPLLLLLGRSHSDPHGPLGVRLIGLVGGLSMLIAFFIFRHYPFRGKSGAYNSESAPIS
ncbi:MAG TPA: MFS transporter [Anaerolineae bacterium]|nr:MFS transporter [Anaerolineae bacterium]HQH38208.1 MFS transporter [Anaerolineae bacterium]